MLARGFGGSEACCSAVAWSGDLGGPRTGETEPISIAEDESYDGERNAATLPPCMELISDYRVDSNVTLCHP